MKKTIIYFCAAILSMCVVVSILSYFIELSAFKMLVDNFSIIIALISLFLAFESSVKSEKATEIECLMGLHQKLIDNNSIFELYKKLDSMQEIDINESRYAIMQYLSFFDHIVVMLNYKLIRIEDVDDYFSYYFFVLVNNKTIQKYLEDKREYYSKVYHLYNLLYDYRIHHGLTLIRNETPLIVHT